MDVMADEDVALVNKHGRQASATVAGKRKAGYLLGNRFVYSDESGTFWMECGPGEFKELKLWRK